MPTPEQVLRALLKQPDLAWQTALLLQASLLAGPWVITEAGGAYRPGVPQGGLAAPNRLGSVGLVDRHSGFCSWIVTTRKGGNESKNQGTAPSVEWAQAEIDTILLAEGYAFAGVIHKMILPSSELGDESWTSNG